MVVYVNPNSYPVSGFFLPRPLLPCHGRRWRCCSGRLWSRPVAVSLSQPASYSSCWDTWASHNCCVCVCMCGCVCVCVRMCVCMWQEVGTLLLHLPIFSNIFKCSLGWGKTTFDWWLKLTWWVTPLQNRSDALCPHSVWLYIVSGLLPPL